MSGLFNAHEASAWVAQLLDAGASRQPVAAPGDFAERCTPALAREMQAAHVQGVLAREGGAVVGFKIGGTTEAGLARLGLDCPFTGPIFSTRHHRSGARLARADFIVCIVEAEVGVQLRHDITPPVSMPSAEALLDHIKALCPAIELADSRMADWTAAPATAIVADLGFAGAWVQGEPCTSWRAHELRTLGATLQLDGRLVREGRGSVVLGDPLRSLALVIAEHGRRGETLKAGQWISTGSWTAPWPLAVGEVGRIDADFGPLGRVSVDVLA